MIIAKRDKPVAAILSVDHYNEMASARKRLARSGAKRVLKLSGLGKPSGELDQAIHDLRKSRVMAIAGSPKR